MGRSKLVSATKKVVQHDVFINRIRKSLYYGVGTADTDMEVSLPLAEYAAEMFSEPHRGHSLHRLSCVAAAKVQATPCSLIMALIYLDRLSAIDPGYSCRITPQELFVVSLMVSTKFYAGHDERFYLEDWANEGNMTEQKLKEMELEFLSAMDWNIYISNEKFFDKLISVERTLAERQGLRRGWLTYSELVQLLPSFAWTKFLVNSVSVLALSYAASVITLAGAFFIASQVPGTLWHRRVDTAPEAQLSALKHATSVSTPQGPSVIDHEVSALPLNKSCAALDPKLELQKLEQQYCVEARLNEMEYSRRLVKSVPNLPLMSNYPKLELFLSLDGPRNWLNIKSQYSDYQDHPNYWITLLNIQLENHSKHNQNGSVFLQLITEAIKQSFLIRWPEMWPKLI
ncbi:protein CNPPD1 isoform X2 [Drosophila rhopaloa]|uniref:Protein CNPPD1 n=1 Tax=Drosophila rhopaloa TaxID=1041015 RepID=A0A6P4DYV0_DRORH|nr:protein CNPPD1 isoform X2 [Drosophila rhopaloa]